ncbi:MAG TPA: magnesium transporter [Lactobacillaceae bacterium]|jgi:magnesium transporter
MDEQNDTLQEALEVITNDLQTGNDTTFVEDFNALHGYEMGQVYVNLAPELRPTAWRLLDLKTLGKTFDHIDAENDDVLPFLLEMPPRRGADVLQEMYTDNAVDVLHEMNDRQLATYLNLLPKAAASEMRALLGYEEQTAGALMSTDFLSVDDQLTVGQALQWVKQHAEESEAINYVYVLDGQERLVGVLSLRDLLTHPDANSIMTITNTRVISVDVADEQQGVAKVMNDYNFVALPVVDDAQHLLGVITVDDIVDVMDEEAVADYSGLAGLNVTEVADSPWRSALKRIPWLVILLVLGMGTASVINHFEGVVRQASILAVFISLVTGTAGNAGTQAIALAVRRLTVAREVSYWRILGSELVTGLLVGATTGLTIFLMITIWQHNVVLGFTVGFAMGVAILVANLAGTIIPALIDRIGLDPAVASGPFISTLSDLTSTLIYFSIAQLLITKLMG